MTKLQDMQIPVMISEENVRANLQHLNKIKSELEKCTEQRKTTMIDLINRQIEIENGMKDLLKPMQDFFETSVKVSVQEEMLIKEMAAFSAFFVENKTLLGGKKYNEYAQKVKSLSDKFSDLKVMKCELDKSYQVVKPQIGKFNGLNGAVEKNGEVLPIITSIAGREENIRKLEFENAERLVRMNELETNLAKNQEILNKSIEKTFGKTKTDKKKHSKTAASTSSKHTKNKTQDQPIANQPIKRETFIPTNFLPLIDESKRHHDQQASFYCPYNAAVGGYSGLENDFAFCVDKMKDITSGFNKLEERRIQEMKRRASLQQASDISIPVSTQGRQQNAFYQPARESTSLPTKMIQQQPIYQRAVK